MKGELLPDKDYVVRVCGGSHVQEDGKIAPAAFRARPSEAYLSVNWLECLGMADRAAQLDAIRQTLAAKRSVGATARLALLNVGTIHAVSSSGNAFVNLRVRHEPVTEPPDPSHSGIHGVAANDLNVSNSLSALVFELFPAR
jgi:hypothetical protein